MTCRATRPAAGSPGTGATHPRRPRSAQQRFRPVAESPCRRRPRHRAYRSGDTPLRRRRRLRRSAAWPSPAMRRRTAALRWAGENRFLCRNPVPHRDRAGRNGQGQRQNGERPLVLRPFGTVRRVVLGRHRDAVSCPAGASAVRERCGGHDTARNNWMSRTRFAMFGDPRPVTMS